MPKKKDHERLLNDIAQVKAEVEVVTDRVSSVLKNVKKHYNSLDEKTKKKIVGTITGLGMVLAARHIYKKHGKKNRAK